MITELVVAAGLLMTAVAVVTPLAVKGGRLWLDSRHYRLAVDEVSNQLERLTALNATDRSAAIASLEPSPQAQRALPRPVLTAETLADEYGERLVVSLNWARPRGSKPVSLVGWIPPENIRAEEER
jgi:hypothetical protein